MGFERDLTVSISFKLREGGGEPLELFGPDNELSSHSDRVLRFVYYLRFACTDESKISKLSLCQNLARWFLKPSSTSSGLHFLLTCQVSHDNHAYSPNVA